MALDAQIARNGFGSSFSVQYAKLQAAIESTPRLAYRHIRDAMGGMMGSHRREFLERTQVQFDASGKGMGADALNSRRESISGSWKQRRTFYYKVFPREKKVPKGQIVDLGDIFGESYTISEQAQGLELGGSFKAKGGGLMVVPIGYTRDALGRVKGRWATPYHFRKASAGNKLVAIKFRRYPRYYIVQTRNTQAARSAQGAFTPLDARPTGRKTRASRFLIPAFQTIPGIKRRALLGYLDSWDQLGQDRTRRLRQALNRIVQDIDNGITS